MAKRKLVVGTFLTLDGVMQAPGGPEEDREGGFKHGGWSVKYWDDAMGQIIVAQMKNFDALLLGRKTYEIFASHWPRVENDPIADKLNSVPKFVASRTLKKVEWKNSTLLKGDVPAAVAKLKEQPGSEILVQGSSNLIQTLLRHDLIDEFNLWVFPLVLGDGKRLFQDGTIPAAWRLTDSKASSTGVQIQRLQRAGKVEYGTFALEESKAGQPDRTRGP